jgi:hypothetical protein
VRTLKTVVVRAVLAVAVLAAALAAPPAALAVQAPAAVPVMAQLLFVQNAEGVAVSADGKTLTLKGISPTTLFFSDRPIRIAGHYRTAEYLDFWKAGPDTFLKDPPNATLSAFQEGKDELSDVVVTLRNPRVEGKDLRYDISVISGKLPVTNAGPVSLFIDIIGLPFTPLSFAGVARRTAYRTVVWGGAAAASADAAAVATANANAAAANAAAASAHQAAVAAQQAQAAAAAGPAKSPQQKLQELQSLYDQKLISASDYEAAKKKILSQLTQ